MIFVKELFVPHRRIFHAAIHGERVFDILYIADDAVGCAGEKEHIGEPGVDHGDDIVVSVRSVI